MRTSLANLSNFNEQTWLELCDIYNTIKVVCLCAKKKVEKVVGVNVKAVSNLIK